MELVSRAIVLGALIVAATIAMMMGTFLVEVDKRLFWPMVIAVVILGGIAAVYWFVFHDELRTMNRVAEYAKIVAEREHD